MRWAKVELDNFVDLISGPAFKSEKFTESEEDIPLVKGDNISQGYIDWKKSKYWPRNDVEKYSQHWLEEGDVILAMDRPWVTAGLKFSWIKPSDPKALLVQRVARMRGKNGLLTDYLRYIVGSKSFSDYIKNIMGGTNVPHISGKQIKAYEILLPPEPTQEEIVKHLATYDDLIENNKRRIELLEESARQLYKEWFVRFRFPGHEHVKIIDGVPEGWRRGNVSDFGEVITGKTPSTKIKENFDGDIPFIKTPDMHASSIIIDPEEYLSERGANTQANKYLPRYSVLVACIGARLGVVSLNARRCQTNQQINAVIPRSEIYTFYAYLTLNGFREKLLAIGGGATMPNVNKSKFSGMDALIPSESLLGRFQDMVAQSFFQMENLIEMNSKLVQARDLLLPKLMSGEITA